MKKDYDKSPKFKVKRGDTVIIITGQSKGTKGKVASVDTKKMRVHVEGSHSVKRHTKPSRENPEGGIIEKKASIHISNVMRIDEKTDKPTRARRVK